MNIKNILKHKYLFLFIAIACISAVVINFSKAATVDVDELKFKKSQLQEKLDAINKQIQSFQGQISATRKQQASLKNEISIYDNQIKSTKLQIEANETNIEDVNLQVDELQKQIDRRVKEIEENKKVLKQLILELNELGNNSFIQLALGTGDFSGFLDELQYTNSLQDKVYQIVQNIKEVKSKLEGEQKDLRVQLVKLQGLKDQLQNTEASLAAQQRDKQSLLDKTKGVEKNYQKLLTTSQGQEADLQKEIEGLDEQVRKQLGQKTSGAKKGSLVMPMNGILTQGYGNTGFRALGYSFHNGIDIAAPAGTPIYAAQDGTVNACDTGDASYGNWCTVKHNIQGASGSGCIITLYGHMRSFKVKTGQAVQQGDLIGYEGNTGNTTRLLYGPDRGYHLHFTVFDCDGFGIAAGKFSKVYGSYSVPYGYTYDPRNFLQ